jgi:hypothetical protein
MEIMKSRGWRLTQLALLMGGTFIMARVRDVGHVEACAACIDSTHCQSGLLTGASSCGINPQNQCYISTTVCPACPSCS